MQCAITTFSVLKCGPCPPPTHSPRLWLPERTSLLSQELLSPRRSSGCWLLPLTTPLSPSLRGSTQVTVQTQGHPLTGLSLRFPRKSEASVVAATLALTSPHRNYLFRGLMPQWREWCLIQLCNQPRAHTQHIPDP